MTPSSTNLLIPIDFSAQDQPGAFTTARGDVISITHDAFLPDGHLPPPLRVNVLDGPEVVEVLGTFEHGAIIKRSNSDEPVAISTTPAPSTTLIVTKALGSATVEVIAGDGPKGESYTFTVTVTGPRPEPSAG